MVSERLRSRRLAAVAARKAPATKPAGDDPKKALEDAQKALDSASAISGGFWLSYIFVLLYLAVAAGAVTHVDLLLENPVKLPFLNIELPLIAFFVLAPWLFLAVHAHMLAHFVLLSKKARRYRDLLNGADEPEARREALPINIFIQAMIGPRDVRHTWFGAFLRGIVWLTLVFAPVMLLLELQIQILPHHNFWAIWSARVAIIIDLVLIWALWQRIFWLFQSIGRRKRVKRIAAALASALVLTTSLTLATYPGEWLHERNPDWQILPGGLFADRNDRSLRAFLFQTSLDKSTRQRTSFFANALVLPGFNIFEALKIDDPKKFIWKKSTINLRGRDLRGSVFEEATLGHADLVGANLQGAWLTWANLREAQLDRARLEGAWLAESDLQGASLEYANLQGAELSQTNLRGASLRGARLEGTRLFWTMFEGATLTGAQFQGSIAFAAQMRGADVRGSDFSAALLKYSRFDGADLSGSLFRATSLENIKTWRSRLDRSKFENVYIHASEVNLNKWNKQKYDDLVYSIKSAMREGRLRDDVIEKLKSLDCSRKDLDSCDLFDKIPIKVDISSSVNHKNWLKLRVDLLLQIVCDGNANRIDMLRGMMADTTIYTLGDVEEDVGFGSETERFVLSVKSKSCPVSQFLTSGDELILTRFQERYGRKLVILPPTPPPPPLRPRD